MLAARHAHAEKLNPTLRQRLGPQVRVLEVRVAVVDDQIAVSQIRQQIANNRIDGRSSRYEQHHGARDPEESDKFFQHCCAADVSACRFYAQRVCFAGILVVPNHRMTMISHVQYKVAAHDTQANHADFIALRCHGVLHIQSRTSGRSSKCSRV